MKAIKPTSATAAIPAATSRYFPTRRIIAGPPHALPDQPRSVALSPQDVDVPRSRRARRAVDAVQPDLALGLRTRRGSREPTARSPRSGATFLRRPAESTKREKC